MNALMNALETFDRNSNGNNHQNLPRLPSFTFLAVYEISVFLVTRFNRIHWRQKAILQHGVQNEDFHQEATYQGSSISGPLADEVSFVD
jgi:hypothetical protein